MRYEAHNYGTRDEIIAEFKDRMGGSGSPKRNAEAVEAIRLFEEGAETVKVRNISWTATDAVKQYAITLADPTHEEVTVMPLAATSDDDAWKFAAEMAVLSKQRLIKLYREVGAYDLSK